LKRFPWTWGNTWTTSWERFIWFYRWGRKQTFISNKYFYSATVWEKLDS